MISDKTIEVIQDSVKVEILDIDGVQFTTHEVYDPRKADPTCAPIAVAGLQGLVDAITFKTFEVDRASAIHISSARTVTILGRLFGRFRQREHFASATVDRDKFPFGTWIPVSDFIVAVQARMAPTPDREKVLAVLGNLSAQVEINTQDDGVTQTVTAMAGVARKANVELPNPVVLAPYRTFSEVRQPESPFVLRIAAPEGKAAQVALFEADGGAWRQDAINLVRTWLRSQLPEEPHIPIIG